MYLNSLATKPRIKFKGAITLLTVMLLFLVSGGILLNSARQQLVDLWTSRYQSDAIRTRIQTESANQEVLSSLRQSAIPLTTKTCKVFNQTSPICSTVSSLNNSLFLGSKISTASSADSPSLAEVSRSVGYMNWLSPGQFPAALIFPGSLSSDTELHISPNPNGGGQQIPLAIWATGKIQASTNSSLISFSHDQILQLSLSLDNGIADQAVLHAQGGDFPDDILNYVFGISSQQYPAIQESARILSPDQCQTLNSNSSGLYWIEGTGVCELNNLGKLATTDPKPVILVLHAASLHVQANARIYGLIVDFQDNLSEDQPQSLYFESNSLLYGSLLSNRDLNHHLKGVISIIWQDYSDYFLKPDSSERGAMLLLNSSWIDKL